MTASTNNSLEHSRFTSSPYEPSVPSIHRLEDIDLLDQDLYRYGDPHAVWRMLRETAPVFWHKKGTRGTEGKGFWVLTRYEDTASVYKNMDAFSSEEGPFLDLRREDTPLRILPSLDGATHKLQRSVVSRFFIPAQIKKWDSAVRKIVISLLEGVKKHGECDFSVDIAQKLPFAATCELLGISAVEAQSLVNMLFSMHGHSEEALDEYNEATLKFFDLVTSERSNSDSRDTIVDIVSHAEVDGKPLTRIEKSHLLWVLFFGGIDSTVHAATAGLLALFHHPDQLALLSKDPSLITGGINEIFRWTSPSHANKRKANYDVVIGDTLIKKGDYVSMWSPSANRDEAVFDDPFRFDLMREINRSKPIATFGGGGPHQCIGQFFARLELQILFEELFKYFPDIQQAGPAVRGSHFTILLSPIEKLPIRFTSHLS